MSIKQFASTVRVTATFTEEGKELIQLMVKNQDRFPQQKPLIEKIRRKMTPDETKALLDAKARARKARNITGLVKYMATFLGITKDPVFRGQPIAKYQKYEDFIWGFADNLINQIMANDSGNDGGTYLIQPEDALKLATEAFDEILRKAASSTGAKFDDRDLPILNKHAYRDDGKRLSLDFNASIVDDAHSERDPAHYAYLNQVQKSLAVMMKQQGFTVKAPRPIMKDMYEVKSFVFSKKIEIAKTSASLTGSVAHGIFSLEFDFKLR